MKNIFYLILFSFSQINAQNYTVTKLPANVFNSIENNKQKICEIKIGKEVEIIESAGVDFFKVKSKKCEGYVARVALVETDYIIESYQEALMKQQYIAHRKRIKKEKEEDSLNALNKINIELEKKTEDSLLIVMIKERDRKVQEILTRDSIQEMNKSLERKSKCHFKKNEIDEFTRKKIITTEYYKIKKYNTNSISSVDIKLQSINEQSFVYFFLPEDLGCASPYSSDTSYVIVKLKNGDLIRFNHKGDIDCSNNSFLLISNLTESQKFRLKKSPIMSIRYSGTESYKDVGDIEYINFFIDKLSCIK